jgi:hypothetical protein
MMGESPAAVKRMYPGADYTFNPIMVFETYLGIAGFICFASGVASFIFLALRGGPSLVTELWYSWIGPVIGGTLCFTKVTADIYAAGGPWVDLGDGRVRNIKSRKNSPRLCVTSPYRVDEKLWRELPEVLRCVQADHKPMCTKVHIRDMLDYKAWYGKHPLGGTEMPGFEAGDGGWFVWIQAAGFFRSKELLCGSRLKLNRSGLAPLPGIVINNLWLMDWIPFPLPSLQCLPKEVETWLRDDPVSARWRVRRHLNSEPDPLTKEPQGTPGFVIVGYSRRPLTGESRDRGLSQLYDYWAKIQENRSYTRALLERGLDAAQMHRSTKQQYDNDRENPPIPGR